MRVVLFDESTELFLIQAGLFIKGKISVLPNTESVLKCNFFVDKFNSVVV